jgi:hypothetical protein
VQHVPDWKRDWMRAIKREAKAKVHLLALLVLIDENF